MSLDIHLYIPRDVPCSSCGHVTVIPDRGDESWRWLGLTHNLIPMAKVAGLYQAIWCPAELGFTRAAQLVEVLTAGLDRMRDDPDRFIALKPANGWGSYDGFVTFLEEYLNQCEMIPDAFIEAAG